MTFWGRERNCLDLRLDGHDLSVSGRAEQARGKCGNRVGGRGRRRRSCRRWGRRQLADQIEEGSGEDGRRDVRRLSRAAAGQGADQPVAEEPAGHHAAEEVLDALLQEHGSATENAGQRLVHRRNHEAQNDVERDQSDRHFQQCGHRSPLLQGSLTTRVSYKSECAGRRPCLTSIPGGPSGAAGPGAARHRCCIAGGAGPGDLCA